MANTTVDSSSNFMEVMANFSLGNFISYDCPVYGNNSDYIIGQVVFWVEGVSLSFMAVFGILGNILSSIVLSRPELRNSFNLLLVGLAFFDSCYIMGSLLETVRKSFRAATQLHLLLFPYLLYPGQMIALTGSVFMIVAIAFERYVSVHHPLDYNLAMNDPRGIRTRLIKFLVPVILLSILMNIPKFFETTALFIPISQLNVTKDEVETGFFFPEYQVHLNFTQMRVDPVYSSFVNWSQLFILGIIPVCLLVYFNTKIYQDIRERERRRRPTMPTSQQSRTNNNNNSNDNNPVCCSSLRSNLCNWLNFWSSNTQQIQINDRPGTPPSNSTSVEQERSLTMTSPRNCVHQNEVPNSHPQDTNGMSNARRRKVEDRLALLFMGIVVFFLMCHFPRILLNFYEMLVIEQAMACSRSGHRAFAVWAQIMTSISHFLLVMNSSINILIYSLFNTQFRQAAKRLFEECFGKPEILNPQVASQQRRNKGQRSPMTTTFTEVRRTNCDIKTSQAEPSQAVSSALAGGKKNDERAKSGTSNGNQQKKDDQVHCISLMEDENKQHQSKKMMENSTC